MWFLYLHLPALLASLSRFPQCFLWFWVNYYFPCYRGEPTYYPIYCRFQNSLNKVLWEPYPRQRFSVLYFLVCWLCLLAGNPLVELAIFQFSVKWSVVSDFLRCPVVSIHSNQVSSSSSSRNTDVVPCLFPITNFLSDRSKLPSGIW